MLKKQRVLVTGGAGFVGSHLCEKLSHIEKFEVYSLDNYFTGSKKNHVPNVTYISGECREISKHIRFKPDILFHLGEYSRVEQSFEDIELVQKFNNDSIFPILEFVRKSNCKIIYAGSSTKYGDFGEGKSGSPYAWTKSKNTELVVNYGKWFGINYAITYFYNVYGPREINIGKYATLIALFSECVKNGKPLKVVSPGTQIRNFTHVNDIVDGLILVGLHGKGDEFGIGHHQGFSILDVAALFNGEIKMIPKRKGNRMSADVITEKIIALGWKPKFNLEDYIKSFR
jgi:UDP-glucose 4-epimerase